MPEHNINKKIEEQGKILQELVEQSKKTQKTLNWLRIIGIIKVVAIVAPIVLALIYLPTFAKNLLNRYDDLIPGLQRIQELIKE